MPRGNPNLHGRLQGLSNCTTDSRLEEVARLVAQGLKEGDICTAMSLKHGQVRKLVMQAIDKGLVGKLSDGRNETTEKMIEHRKKIANHAFTLIERRLSEIDDKEALDGRDVNDAFRALSRTEHERCAPKQEEQRGLVGNTTNVVNFFSKEALQKAKENGHRIWGGEVIEVPA